MQYILSDKTGTITKNVMKVRRCSVAGMVYGAPMDVVGVSDQGTGNAGDEGGDVVGDSDQGTGNAGDEGGAGVTMEKQASFSTAGSVSGGSNMSAPSMSEAGTRSSVSTSGVQQDWASMSSISRFRDLPAGSERTMMNLHAK